MQSNELKQPINYLWLFIKHAFLILVVTAIVVVLSVQFNGQKLPKYTATATLIVDFQDPVNTNSVRSTLPAMLQEDYMATQLGIIDSKFMTEKVIDSLDFENDPVMLKVYQWFSENTPVNKSIRVAISDWLLSRLKVYVYNKTTRLIKVAYSHKNKDVAIKVANSFAEKYIQTSLDLNLAPIRSSAAWIEEHTKPIRTALSLAERTLAKDTDIDKINGLLDTAQSDLNNLTLMLNPRKSGQTFSRDNDYLLKIRSDILKKEQLLLEKSRAYGRSHPEYINVVAELRLLKKEFLAEVKKEIASMQVIMQSLNQSLALKSSVNHTNVTLLNYADVDIDSDEVTRRTAAIYGAILGLFLGVVIAFFLIFFRTRQI